jgi:hypothetical protein
MSDGELATHIGRPMNDNIVCCSGRLDKATEHAGALEKISHFTASTVIFKDGSSTRFDLRLPVPPTWTRIAHRSIGSVKLVIHPGARHKPFWLGDNVHVRFRHVFDELIRLDSHLVRLVSQYVVTDSPFYNLGG